MGGWYERGERDVRRGERGECCVGVCVGVESESERRRVGGCVGVCVRESERECVCVCVWCESEGG